MSIRTWIGKNLRSISATVKLAFDIRDLFVFGGLAMMGYGLYLFKPWVAFTVTGAIFCWLGLGIGKKRAK